MPALTPLPVGAAATEIPTPALVVDLDRFERNLDAMAAWTRDRGIRLRPHAKTHKCSEIARRQLAAGAVGVCCQTVREALAMGAAGIGDILLTNNVVQPAALAALAALAGSCRIGLCFDHPEQIRRAARAFAAAGTSCDAYIELDVGSQRSGVQSPEEAVALASEVASHPSLRLFGLQAYNGRGQHLRDPEERSMAAAKVRARVGRVQASLDEAGFRCERVTGGGTGSFAADVEQGALNELQCGSYLFMDLDYAQNEGADAPDFLQSLFVATTVISRPTPDRAVVDAGLKALSFDSGPPVVDGRAELEYYGPNDEHGRIRIPDPAQGVGVGDQLRLVPGHCDPTVALHDRIFAVRDGQVEAIWAVDGRGHG